MLQTVDREKRGVLRAILAALTLEEKRFMVAEAESSIRLSDDTPNEFMSNRETYSQGWFDGAAWGQARLHLIMGLEGVSRALNTLSDTLGEAHRQPNPTKRLQAFMSAQLRATDPINAAALHNRLAELDRAQHTALPRLKAHEDKLLCQRLEAAIAPALSIGYAVWEGLITAEDDGNLGPLIDAMRERVAGAREHIEAAQAELQKTGRPFSSALDYLYALAKRLYPECPHGKKAYRLVKAHLAALTDPDDDQQMGLSWFEGYPDDKALPAWLSAMGRRGGT